MQPILHVVLKCVLQKKAGTFGAIGDREAAGSYQLLRLKLSGGGDIHHELAVYRGGAKGMIGRLLNARVMAPDWVLQFGNADEDGKERRLQILRGREIVWKGWQGEAENTSPYMRSELLKRVRDFYLMLQGHQRRS